MKTNRNSSGRIWGILLAVMILFLFIANLLVGSVHIPAARVCSEVVFKDCTITSKSAKSLIYAYSKPVGKVVFENCIIDVPKDTILFDGYANQDTINIDIEFINTTIVNELKPTHDKFKDNKNIRIIMK